MIAVSSGRSSGRCALPLSSSPLPLITGYVITSVVSPLHEKVRSFDYMNGFETAFFIILISVAAVTLSQRRLRSYHSCHQAL